MFSFIIYNAYIKHNLLSSWKANKTQIKMIKLLLFLFHLLFMTLPFVFTWVNEELFEFNKMLVVYGATLLVGFFWILAVLQKQIKLKATQLHGFFLFFLLSQILASIFSIHQRTSIVGYYTRLHGGLLSTLAYLSLATMFISTIQSFPQLNKEQSAKLFSQRLKGFFYNWLTTGLLVSLWAIPEHFGYSPSCLIITGKFNVACWVQDVQNRVFASFGQPNWLGAYLIMLIPLAIYFFENSFEELMKSISLSSKGSVKKDVAKPLLKLLVFATIASLMWLALLFTKSRSGLVGLALGLGLYFVLSGIVWWKADSKAKNQLHNKPSFISPLLIITGIFLALLLTFGSIYTPNLTNILNRNHSAPVSPTNPTDIGDSALAINTGGTESGDIRKIVWQGAIKIWQRYPIFGSGVETFAYSYYQDRPVEHNLVSEWDFLYNKAHNEFLNFLATTGVVGLVAYLSMLIAGFYIGWQKLLTGEHDAGYLKAILAGLLGLSVSNFFGFSTATVSLVMFVYLAIIGCNQPSTKNTKDNNLQSDFYLLKKAVWLLNHLPMELPVLVFFIITVGGLNKIRNIWLADFNYAVGKQLSRGGELIKASEKLQQAIELSPKEALFYDELAYNYAQISSQLAQVNELASSQEFEQTALQASDIALALNPRHLNFYKTRIRILATLANNNPDYLAQAEEILKTALKLSPTDAKLMYNLSLIQNHIDKDQESLDSLLKAVEMKANYHEALLELARRYEGRGDVAEALKIYQVLEKLLPEDEAVREKVESLKP